MAEDFQNISKGKNPVVLIITVYIAKRLHPCTVNAFTSDNKLNKCKLMADPKLFVI